MQRYAPLLKASSSSNQWLSRQSRDPFIKARNEGSVYRSRSSFKLLALAKKHPELLRAPHPNEPFKTVVDLGAAPGGWSQVAAKLLGERGRVFALDILPLEGIKNVHILQGDFLDPSTHRQLRYLISHQPNDAFGLNPTASHSDVSDSDGSHLNIKNGNDISVDTVLSDMMSPMSGNRTRDITSSLDLVTSALEFSKMALRRAEPGETVKDVKGKKTYPGGNMVYVPKILEFVKVEEGDC